jgi:hypothetical protein
VIRILRLEPSRECSWVAATNNNPIGLIAQVCILIVNEIGNISQCLLSIQILEILRIPVVKWLRLSVESMFKRVEKGGVLRTDHHWVHLLVRGRASPLTADVEEDGALGFAARVKLVVVPVTLLVGAIVFFVEVIEQVVNSVRGIVLHRHLKLHLVRVRLSCVNGKSECTSKRHSAK